MRRENDKLSAADVEIIRSLQADARIPLSKIATRLRIPESTVRSRFNRLVRRRIINFATTTNPLVMGYEVWVGLDIQTQMPKMRSVARRLAEAPEVYFVGITTGTHDVHANAVFRSNQDLLDFITDRLSKIPGIVRTSTSSILEVVKRTLNFPLAADLSAGGRSLKVRTRTRSSRPSLDGNRTRTRGGTE